MAPAAAQVDNTTRRKWDKDEYAAKAKERERLEDEKEKGKNIRPPPGAIIERKTLSLDTIISATTRRSWRRASAPKRSSTWTQARAWGSGARRPG